jgi:hypothetical protein
MMRRLWMVLDGLDAMGGIPRPFYNKFLGLRFNNYVTNRDLNHFIQFKLPNSEEYKADRFYAAIFALTPNPSP